MASLRTPCLRRWRTSLSAPYLVRVKTSARHIRCGQHIDQQVLLLGLAHRSTTFCSDPLGGAELMALHLHGHRVEEDGVGQLLDVLRHGGREEQGLAPRGQELMTLRMSWMKPMSSMVSASSSTKYSRWSNRM